MEQRSPQERHTDYLAKEALAASLKIDIVTAMLITNLIKLFSYNDFFYLWCFTVFHDISMCFTVLFHGVSKCFTVFHGISMCFTVLFHGVSKCFTVFHGISMCFTALFHGVSKCFKVFYFHVSSRFITMKQVQ